MLGDDQPVSYEASPFEVVLEFLQAEVQTMFLAFASKADRGQFQKMLSLAKGWAL